MLRKFAALSLAVSFIAMSTSGLMMFFISRPSFTLQMHPVHKLFGLLMVAAALVHISLNYRALLRHLQAKSAQVYGALLVVALVVLYGVAINKQIPPELVEQMDTAAEKAESHE